MQEADIITVPMDELKKSIISLFPEFKEKIKILPNYIDLEIWGSDNFFLKNILKRIDCRLLELCSKIKE